ncbi:efflux transporter outer membrane subunit [Rubrivivax gelatinosus]|uniref:NodT family efflux transporter outer membrane factor (OMF) lipoprotein n=1 Tax=Rubrivivax gelatinosus TaxID=28068 RepID=A0A4V2SGU4_RUBGE|nr:efflux transporter outer membrane subunit [Rubrivivax gelatinosus]MBK1688215.1 RND transporter [Rubrivivax gelatinosus]TCP02578.1 NodT family efflux transporter outer membrane factor (OMF) lipoprotein [Rubrivivax gelatinosus]
MIRFKPAAAALAAALAAAGCASPGDLPAAHTLASASAAGANDTATPWPAERWWTGFGDTRLDGLVERALAGQPSLLVAAARLRQADAAVGVAAAGRLPQVQGTLDMTRQRFTENGPYPPPLAGSYEWNNGVQIGASWELDLFGRERATIAAALGQRRAAEAELQAARVLLAANVVTAYVNLGRLAESREVARQSLAQREQILALVRQRIAAGLDTTVELRQAEGLIAQSRVELEALEESTARARHALAELTGQGPGALDGLTPALAPLRSTPLPAGLPADLLGRRADLVAQRWRVESAMREVDAARALFYPNVSLTAFAGFSSLGLDEFVKAGSRNLGVGPALSLPIFEGGRLRANLGARAAEVDAAVEGYNGALLRALREVADEVAGLQSLERQQRAQAEAGAAADAAYALAIQRYQAGLGNFLTVLSAQTNVLAQSRAATELKARHLASEVALTRALGGGWAAAADTLPAPVATR